MSIEVPKSVLCWSGAVRATLTRLGLMNALNGYTILAIVWQESTGNPSAWNPEPHYKWLWNVKTKSPFRKLTDEEKASERPPADFPCLAGDPDQEWWGQQVSWGLMQVMGAAARERGFMGPYLPELVHDPLINLEYGIRHFWAYALQYGNRTKRDGLLRWNGGGDESYPDKIFAKESEVEKAMS